MPGDFGIVLGGFNYTIPMRQMVADVSSDDCDIFLAELDSDLEGSANDVRLGDPFFAAFMPIFDVEND